MEELLAKNIVNASPMAKHSAPKERHPTLVDSGLTKGLNNRLNTHLYTLDLYLEEKSALKEDRFELALDVLKSIHYKWKPNTEMQIPLISSELEIPLGVSKQNAALFEALNPSSILRFMLQFMAESKLTNTQLQQALILDFLTATLAAETMIQSLDESYNRSTGPLPKLLEAVKSFFWKPELESTEPLFFHQNSFESGIYPLIESVVADHDYYKKWKQLKELKNFYFDALKQSGLSKDDLHKAIK